MPDPDVPILDSLHDRASLRNEVQRLDLIAVAGEVRAAEVRRTLQRTAAELADTRARLAVAEAQVIQDGHDIAFRDLQIAEREGLIIERDRLVNHYRGFETAYIAVTQSTMWRALGVVRRGIEQVPIPVRRAIRLGAKLVLWAATPWRIGARLQRRRDHFAALAAPPPPLPEPPAPELPAPEPPAPEPPPPPPFDRFSLDHVAVPGAGYLPLIAAFDPVAPEVSVVIPNWNGGAMTLLCLQHLWQHTTGHHYEIIVADNGSQPDEVARLKAETPLVRVLPLGGNRYFGEAANIGVEAAQGRLVCLLNNDAFVQPGWLEPLVAALDDPAVGVAGPRLLNPDGSLQEAGRRIAPDGTILPAGEDASGAVDYVSSACMVLRRADFTRVLGFDLAWEPASYEDADLCLKLRALGLGARHCPDSIVTHIGGATVENRSASLRLGNVSTINRGKFAGRWERFLRAPDGAPPELLPDRPVMRPVTQAVPARPALRVLIFSPYMLTPGGGERYILTIAEALKNVAAVALVMPYRVSRLRLLTVAREFRLDVEGVELLCPGDLDGRPAADLAFLLGNEVYPTRAGLARHNVYICQFPFPFETEDDAPRRLPFWREMELVVTYSDYVSTHLRREVARRGAPPRRVEVLAPPVPMITPAPKRRGQILHVGRFFVGGHCKRQDALIDAFRTLHATGAAAELHLAGSVMPEMEHRAYYAGLLEQAADLPVHFHPNCSAVELNQLYGESDLYWHATGLGLDTEAEPYRAEHFGISVVEAMSAGCIPLVFAAGGPASVVQDGVTGFHFRTPDQLAERTRVLLAADDSAADTMRAAAATAARAYDEETFRRRVRAIASRWHAPAGMEPQGAAASL